MKKKIILMLMTLVMSFAMAVTVMAAPSPTDDYLDDPGEPTTESPKDKDTKIPDDEFDHDKKPDNDGGNGSSSKTTTVTSTSTSSSPKTGDQGAPVTLVYASLAAAALAVYAAKHVKEQY